MNWLYITVIVYIVLSAMRGYHKGFLRVVFSTASIIITAAFMMLTVSPIAGLLQEYTPLEEQLEQWCTEYMQDKAGQEMAESILAEQFEHSFGAVPQLFQILPQELQDELKQQTGGALKDVFGLEEMYEKAAEVLAAFLVYVAAGIISFVIIRILLYFAGKKLKKFTRKPPIRLIDRVLGFAVGTAKAFLVLSLVFLLLRLTAFLPYSASAVSCIEAEPVLKNLYENNWLFDLIKNAAFLKPQQD